jgi:hypothetical protein
MVRHTGKDLAQTVFFDSKTEAFFQDFGALLKDEDFEAVLNAPDIGSGAVEGQCGFADD